MEAKILSSQEVRGLFSSNDEVAYIDVRTVAEFAAGHPRGKVVNIPIVFHHPTTKEIYPNNSFLEVVSRCTLKRHRSSSGVRMKNVRSKPPADCEKPAIRM